MQAFFTVSEVAERAQAESFSQRFGVDLEKLEQGPGVVGDYEVLETSDFTRELESVLEFPLKGRAVEFKCDNASQRTGRFFVEFEQTSDSWYTRKLSGHEKAIVEGCVLVISSGPICFIYNSETYDRLIDGSVGERCTKFRKNGNSPCSFTRARLVPLEHARKTASFVYDMSEHAGFQAIAF